MQPKFPQTNPDIFDHRKFVGCSFCANKPNATRLTVINAYPISAPVQRLTWIQGWHEFMGINGKPTQSNGFIAVSQFRIAQPINSIPSASFFGNSSNTQIGCWIHTSNHNGLNMVICSNWRRQFGAGSADTCLETISVSKPQRWQFGLPSVSVFKLRFAWDSLGDSVQFFRAWIALSKQNEGVFWHSGRESFNRLRHSAAGFAGARRNDG